MNYDWDAHWRQLAADVTGREEEVVSLALVLHDVFDGRAWATGEMGCWCATFEGEGEFEVVTYHSSPETNCWRLAACILLEWKP